MSATAIKTTKAKADMPNGGSIASIDDLRSHLRGLPKEQRGQFIVDSYERFSHIPIVREEVRRNREVNIERSANFDDEKLEFDLSFASEFAVERWFGMEVLDCSRSSVELARINDGAPLLIGHNPDNHQGVIEKASVDSDRICRARVRCADDEDGKKIYRRVKSGIIRKVSVGYRVNELVLAEQSDGELDTYRATKWQPHEISLVSIPADSSVGVGRSQLPAPETPAKNTRTMPPETTTEEKKPEVQVREQPTKAALESVRMSEIRSIGEAFKVPQDRINAALTLNEPLDEFRQYVLTDIVRAKAVAVPPELGMTRKEKRRYSLSRAMNRVANRESLKGTFEGECSDAAATQYKREAPPTGFIMPHDMSMFEDREMMAAMLRVSPNLARTAYGKEMQRALFATVYPGAGALVPQEFLGGSFIDILRNKMLLTQLGVGTLSGLVGNVAIPRQSGAATAYWLSENADVTASQQQFAQVAATPKRLSAQTAFTKQLLAQAGLDAEALIRDDLMRVIAIAKDLAGIAGTGGAQPLGILNGPLTDSAGASTTNVLQTVTFGGAPTWTNIVAFEAAIETQNADLGTMQWLSNPTVRAKWKTTVKVANYPVFLVGDDNQANGYPVNITNQVGTSGTFANRAIFGAWGQAMYCDWAGMDVVIDPYTLAASNKIVVTVNQFADFIVRHWPSFCVSTDSGAQ